MPVPPAELSMLASAAQPKDIKELAEENALSYQTAYAAVRSLEDQGLVKTWRDGKKRVVQPSDPALSGLAQILLFESPRQDLDRLFHGDRLLQFHALHKVQRPDLAALITNRTPRAVYQTIQDFAPSGFLVRTEEGFQLHPRQANYWRFIEDVARLHGASQVQEIAKDGVLVWYLGPEFIFKSREEVQAPRVHRAGFDRFAEFGIELIGGEFRAYHWAHRELDASDAVFESIILNGDTPTHRSYCALLLEAQQPSDFLKKAEIYGMRAFAEALQEYVSNHKAQPGFLPWSEHERYRAQYLSGA
jgi:hypothetical protein